MKEKQMACFILGMAIFACFFGMMKMQAKLQDARAAANDAKMKAETTHRQRIVAQGNFADLKEKTAPEIAYYEIWKVHFENYSTGNAVTDKILTHMKEQNINPFTQNFVPAAYKDKFGVITQLQRVDLVLVGDYQNLFRWLGQLETDLQTARVTSLTVRKATGDEDIHMELSIDIPVIEPQGAALADASS